MPRVFKTLASIVAWILFVWGCIELVYFSVTFGMGEPCLECEIMAIACLILSVCAMKLRKMLE